MIVVFYKTENSQGFGRHSFDSASEDDIMRKIKTLNKDEYFAYDTDDKLSMSNFKEDWNDEFIDNGSWCVAFEDIDGVFFDTNKEPESEELVSTKFIILHKFHGGQVVLNTDLITSISYNQNANECGKVIEWSNVMMSDGNRYEVKETQSEILKMLGY